MLLSYLSKSVFNYEVDIANSVHMRPNSFLVLRDKKIFARHNHR